MSRKFYHTDIGTIDDWVLLSKTNACIMYSVARKYFFLLIWPPLARKFVTTTVCTVGVTVCSETHTKHTTAGELNSPIPNISDMAASYLT